MTDIIEGYLREVSRALRASPREREQIERELRSHLHEKLNALREEQPDASDEALQRQVVDDFGSPQDLALAYTDEGPEIVDESGRTLLAVGRAVGRGTGKLLKGLGIGVLALVLVVAGLGIWAFYEVRPYVEGIAADHVETEAYGFHEVCAPDACTVHRPAQSFHIPAGTREVRFDLDVDERHDEPLAGAVTVRVADGDGTLVYNRTFVLENRSHLSEEARWAPVTGNWSIEIELTSFTGMLDVEVDKVGADPATFGR